MKKIFVAVMGVVVLGLQACGGSGSVSEEGTTERMVLNTSTGEYYFTIQEAYSDSRTTNGHVIKVPAIRLVEHLTFNRDIPITIEGGCDSSYSACTGVTQLVGSITTTQSGGTIAIKNFTILAQ